MIGKQIKDYKIEEEIGEGGMAFVYLATNVNLGSKVAIKLLKDDFVGHPNIRKRFLAEAKNLAQMNHPNVVRVIDLIDAGDIVAFVMEYVEGNTLEEKLLKEGKLSDHIISTFLTQMILAIDYVHKQGFIHRDIKPSNFLITGENQIKLLDFGIAKNTNDVSIDYTKTGLAQQMGTPLYMSPEQIKNTSEVTKQTDFYSLGVVLWEMIMGKKPYDSRDLSLPEIQVSILKEVLPLTNSKWDKVIQKATQKEETKRFQSTEEFLLDFDFNNNEKVGKIEVNNQIKTELDSSIKGEEASLFIRFLNFFLDYLTIVGIIKVLSSIGYLGDSLDLFFIPLEPWFFWIFYFLYFLFFEFFSHRTIAKYITNTKVISTDKSTNSFLSILKRSFWRILPIDIISYLFPFFHIWNHDSISKTKVINFKKINKKSLNISQVFSLLFLSFLIFFCFYIPNYGYQSPEFNNFDYFYINFMRPISNTISYFKLLFFGI